MGRMPGLKCCLLGELALSDDETWCLPSPGYSDLNMCPDSLPAHLALWKIQKAIKPLRCLDGERSSARDVKISGKNTCCLHFRPTIKYAVI